MLEPANKKALLNTVMVSKLTTSNHNSDSAGLNYIYPVISRRVGGLSIGINFNTNNACNWRCVYCQVANLKRGAAPDMDFQLLEKELRFFLDDVLQGDFYERFSIDADKRGIKDIAIAGNGEPTSLKDFAQAVELIGKVATEAGVLAHSDYILITNGSLIQQPRVQEGLKVLNKYGGEVWFKLDSATEEGRKRFNHASLSCRASVENLLISAKLCPTKLQTCLFDYDNQGLSDTERHAYLALLKTIKNSCDLKKIMLYTLARPSLQQEANRLEKLPADTLNSFAEQIRQLGFTVSVNA
jgi:wyosine [tRNA(Phe)-imidazoG37] synthetase (radical SAM superfamily)